jgi:DNA helicase II / ATP-dependent DNA helicase PcrA
MGTFHKFGLDLLRRYHKEAGITPKPKVIDTLDAQLLLEQNLGILKLNHFRSLSKPAGNLKYILNEISRAKDQLLSPEKYLRRVEESYKDAQTEADKKQAEKAFETAKVYEIYQKLLVERNWLDYGDLLFRAVTLLQENESVRLRQRDKFKHILVDEYQDVNKASRFLLKLLAGNGSGLWVVGDTRQSIYRFMGASPDNIRLLTTEDFPDAITIKLNTNYRSQSPVVKVFAACSNAMSANEVDEIWDIERKDEAAAEIRYFVSSDEKLEVAELAGEIKRLDEEGVEFRQQAVLCRSHADLARLSEALENAEIPTLYLGNFFERPEIRDLLSVIAMAFETDGRSLYRLSNFKEYGFSQDDIKLFTDYISLNRLKLPNALAQVSKVTALSTSGRVKLELLAGHFTGFHYGNSAWHILSQYLFVKSDYLRFVAVDDSVGGLQRRLAIYQLLLFTYQLREEFASEDGDAKRLFLNYLKHLRINDEDKQLRQTPNWAEDINAVRLMTVHSAKGLEWKAVHLPMLSEGKFPSHNSSIKKPTTSKKLFETNDSSQDEEENCLFFVALSRARDHLCLYRSREKRHSRLLDLISEELPHAICKPPEYVKSPPRITTQPEIVKVKRPYSERELQVYRKCPLEYKYRYILGIAVPRSDTPIGKTHLCVYLVCEAIKNEQNLNGEVTNEFVENKIAEVWTEYGPTKHPYEPDYQNEARQMIQRIFERPADIEDRLIQEEWKVELNNGIVTVKPDYIDFIDENGSLKIIVEKLNFGKVPEKIEDDIYALFEKAVVQYYQNRNYQMQATYMGDNTSVKISRSQTQINKSVSNYEKAIKGILAKDFTPRVDNKTCPLCSYYTICSSNDKEI